MDRAVVDVSPATRVSARTQPRQYRLIELDGSPHPVLDDLYDSLEGAWEEARHWWQKQVKGDQEPVGIAVEVSTGCGSWRRLRHPGS